jgi:acyl dehydratase
MMVEAGTAIPEFAVSSVPTGPMKTMALLLRDPNPIHWDQALVGELGMGDRVINQGPTNMAYVLNMLIAWTGDPAHVRSMKVRFQDNVLAGDHVVAGGVVTDVRDEGGERIAYCDIWLDVIGGSRAMSGTAAVVV